MANWAERAEQERQRIAGEQAALRRAADARRQQEQRAGQAEREIITRMLNLFHRLGIPKTLEELRRDIWKGKGQVAVLPLDVGDDWGKVGAKLECRALVGAEEDKEPIGKYVNGKYDTGERDIEDGGTVWGYGRHFEASGYRIKGAKDVFSTYSLRAELIVEKRWQPSLYYRPDVACEEGRMVLIRAYGGPCFDEGSVASYFDSAFLEFATKSTRPDFYALEAKARQERAAIMSRVGKKYSY